ncbi:hypothetical protein BTUL_0057g00510 [Botrytis tulipae]|uniref:Uncharacterized protein n=1 Tax=Botrytis tulipae TaxID=87230 RepID=A0A4Z1EPD6_9HELO|nr:hypothetical protein BTUL_0057g00510 [Botrytis tulipae]
MQLQRSVLLLLASAIPAYAAYCLHSEADADELPITYRYYNSGNGHWSWNAQSGGGVIQDDGWMYFDGDMHSHTAVMSVTFNDGSTTQYTYSTNDHAKGWCQIYPPGAQNNIADVSGG